jgi:RNA polymerase sigma-70 factor (ECF subfamily)
MDPRGDEELLEATARGEADAFAMFYRRHARPMTGFFVRRTGDAEIAADLVAETFAAALEGCGRYEPARAPAGAWLYGIAHHELAQRARGGPSTTARGAGSGCRGSSSPRSTARPPRCRGGAIT